MTKMKVVHILLVAIVAVSGGFASAQDASKKDAEPNRPNRFTMDELRNVQIEIKDVIDSLFDEKSFDEEEDMFSNDLGDTEETLLSDAEGAEEIKNEKPQNDLGKEARFHATVTDAEFGTILRDDEEGAYLKESRFVTDADDIFIDDEEKAITVDEARRRETIDVDDDGSPEFLEKNSPGEKFYDEDNEDEEFEELNHVVKRKAFIRFRALERFVTRTARNIGNGVTQAVKTIGKEIEKVVHKGTKFVEGAVKAIPFKEIGKAIGKAAEHMLEFAKCAVPGMDMLDKCGRQAIKSIGNSCSRNNCHIKLGGRGSGCLSFAGSETVSKSHGPVTVSGTVGKEAGFVLQYYFQTGKIVIEFYGHLTIKPKLQVALSQKYSGKKYKKRVPLTKHAKTVFRKLIIITIGTVPIPVLLEVKVQPVARITLGTTASGSGSISFELTEAAKVSLDSLTVTYDPYSGPRATAKTSNNLDNLKVTKKLSLTGTASLTGTVHIGPEITVSVSGIPIKLFPAVEFQAKGTLTAGYTNGKTCASGTLQFSTSLMALLIPDISSLTSISSNFGKACKNLAYFQCKINPVGRAANCFAKTFLNKDPCAEMAKGCDELKKQMEIIPDIIQRNPVLATIDFLRKGLADITIGKKCGSTSGAPTCTDRKKSSCPRWANKGYCTKYYVSYMKKNCCGSCKKAKGK